MKRNSLILFWVLLTFIFIHNCKVAENQEQKNTQQVSMLKGPYLLYSGIKEISVIWQIDKTFNCIFKWGLTENCDLGSVITNEADSSVGNHIHSYKLNKLNSGVKYFYKVVINEDEYSGSFISHNTDYATNLKFIGFGDTRSHPSETDKLSKIILSTIGNDPDYQTFIIHSGDWNSDGSESSWRNEFFNRSYSNNLGVQSKFAIMGARGNHEDSAEDLSIIRKYWPYGFPSTDGFYYSFDTGPLHVTVIDQYVDYSRGSDQLNWAESDLANSAKKWKIVVFHEPAYTDEGYHNNNYEAQDNIISLCRRYGVRVVINGHNHYYAHCYVNGIHHLTLGAAGAPLYEVSGQGEGLVYSQSVTHFAKFEITGDIMAVKIIDEDSNIVESFSIHN